MPMGVEESIGASLRHNRAFAALGLDSIMKAQRATERHMDRLESENTELRKENAKLRNKLVEHWDMAQINPPAAGRGGRGQ